MLSHSKTIMVVFFLGLLATACNADIGEGGKCDFVDERYLTRVVSNDEAVVELAPVHGEVISLSAEEFDSPVMKNDYYELFVRHHTSGGCSPFSVTKKVKMVKENVSLSPTDQYAYAAAFILDEAKNCAYSELANSCESDLRLDVSFDHSQLTLLSYITPRSVGYCSTITMEKIWPEIESAESQTRIITCVDNNAGEEMAVEFSLSDDETSLLLRKIY